MSVSDLAKILEQCPQNALLCVETDRKGPVVILRTVKKGKLNGHDAVTLSPLAPSK